MFRSKITTFSLFLFLFAGDLYGEKVLFTSYLTSCSPVELDIDRNATVGDVKQMLVERCRESLERSGSTTVDIMRGGWRLPAAKKFFPASPEESVYFVPAVGPASATKRKPRGRKEVVELPGAEKKPPQEIGKQPEKPAEKALPQRREPEKPIVAKGRTLSDEEIRARWMEAGRAEAGREEELSPADRFREEELIEEELRRREKEAEKEELRRRKETSGVSSTETTGSRVTTTKSGLKIKQKPLITGIGVAATVATIGALYAGLKWYQRRSILRVISKRDLNIAAFSPTQKDAMAVAFRASYRVPGSRKKLAMLAKKPGFVSETISADSMWGILAEIYYKKSPTPEQIQRFKRIVG